jgi:hypothetical protein
MRTRLVHIDQGHVEQLFSEIDCYLAAVDVFRSEGFEPRYEDDEWLWRLYGDVLTACDARNEL